jgi:glycine hydroxymethyltransferase
MAEIARFIHQALSAVDDSERLAELKADVAAFCESFPLHDPGTRAHALSAQG